MRVLIAAGGTAGHINPEAERASRTINLEDARRARNGK